MPPLPLLPNQPIGSPDWRSPSSYPSYMMPTGGGMRHMGSGSSMYGYPQQQQDPRQENLARYLEELANEDARRFDEELDIKRRDLDQRYEIAKQSARNDAERNQIDREYRQAQVQIAREQLQFDRERFGQEFQQKAFEFAQTLGLSRDQFQEGIRQFDATQQQRESEFSREFGQRGYEFDTTTEEGRRRFDAEFGQRGYEYDTGRGDRRYEYDTTTAEGRRRYDTDFGQRQYEFGAEFGQRGYEFDANLGQRESEFARTHGLNQAELGYDLLDTQARLAQNPEDYWYEAERARGMAEMPETATFLTALRNNTSLPGYGMQGAGAPVAGSLQNVEARMGYVPPAAGGGVPTAPGTAQPLSPAEQSRVDQITARRAELRAAGAGDVSPEDLAELQGYMARGARPTIAPAPITPAPPAPTAGQQPLSPQEQARAEQIHARRMQLQAAGEGDVSPEDLAALQGYVARGARLPTPSAGGGAAPSDRGYREPVPGGDTMYAGGTPGFNERMGTYAPAPVASPVGQWRTTAQPSAGMVRPGAAPTAQPAAARPMVSAVQQARQQRDAQNLAAIRGIAQAGAHKLGNGALENMSDTEYKLFSSGLGRAGVDKNTFLSQYRQSRIGNRSGMARVA